MMSRALKLVINLNIHVVSCPGVWLSGDGNVSLSLCVLGFHIQTRSVPPILPLVFNEKMQFEKVFRGCTQLRDLDRILSKESVYVELLQHVGATKVTVLAIFETSVKELFYPFPSIRPLTGGVDTDLLMEPTRDFPGIIGPKIQISSSSVVKNQKNDSLSSRKWRSDADSQAINAGELRSKKSYRTCCKKHEPRKRLIHRRSRSVPTSRRKPHQLLENRPPFVWRHVDDNIFSRFPDSPMYVDYSPKPRRSQSTGSVDKIGSHHPHTTFRHVSSQDRDSVTKYMSGGHTEQSTARSHSSPDHVVTGLKKGRRIHGVDKTKDTSSQLSQSPVGHHRSFSTTDNAFSPHKSTVSLPYKHSASSFRKHSTSSPHKSSHHEDDSAGESVSEEDRDAEPEEHDYSRYPDFHSDRCPHCVPLHSSRGCTVCRLYRQYFGEHYRPHSSSCSPKRSSAGMMASDLGSPTHVSIPGQFSSPKLDSTSKGVQWTPQNSTRQWTNKTTQTNRFRRSSYDYFHRQSHDNDYDSHDNCLSTFCRHPSVRCVGRYMPRCQNRQHFYNSMERYYRLLKNQAELSALDECRRTWQEYEPFIYF